MPLTLWLSLAAVCALGAMSPGPSLAMVLRHTLGGGRTPGVIAGLTHAMGVGLYALLTVWGLGAVISRQPMLFMVITWGGAAYLACLGIKALRAGRGGALEAQGAASGPAQAASRTLLARVAPASMMGEFFGLYALSGKATSFMAPLAVALLTSAFASQRAGISVILVFLVVGLGLLLFVSEERAPALH